MCYRASGFLVTDEPVRISDTPYFGVDTNAWPIGTSFASRDAAEYCEIAYHDLSFPMLIDYDSALDYYHLCLQVGNKPRLLFCEVMTNCMSCALPHFINSGNSIFLGFDYAYPSGDYYSAIANDILYDRNGYFAHWKSRLNEFGLLTTEEELLQFVQERTQLVKEFEECDKEMQLEKGFFACFRLFLVDYHMECY